MYWWEKTILKILQSCVQLYYILVYPLPHHVKLILLYLYETPGWSGSGCKGKPGAWRRLRTWAQICEQCTVYYTSEWVHFVHVYVVVPAWTVCCACGSSAPGRQSHRRWSRPGRSPWAQISQTYSQISNRLSWASNNTAATSWSFCQANKFLTIAFCLYSWWQLYLDSEALTFFLEFLLVTEALLFCRMSSSGTVIYTFKNLTYQKMGVISE